ncbi:aminopeptidase [Microbacterium paraoxydans]|uniref:aminopeptidase n=1 Tax=Microbacterium paraoxydans TaxID=199592 RepID=UPI0006884208|nr:aminopeptidase [Microbacterium paraoxydans]
MQQYTTVVKNILANNITLDTDDRVLVLTDESTAPIASGFLAGLRANDVQAELYTMEDRAKSGEEPAPEALERVLAFDATFCLTKHSLTHTSARKQAVAAGKLFITMPGITEYILTEGAMTADYVRVERETLEMAKRITDANAVTIHSGDGRHRLHVPLEGRDGIPSTGVFHGKGTGGNLPSGEAYVAPVEYAVSGTLEVNGSIAGIGLVDEPVVLEVRCGRLESATGPLGARLLEMLGDGLGRQVAELGIGTNHAAGIIGDILEDEKAYNTIHIAFGSNNTFGGTIAAGVHIDCIVASPRVEWA